MTLRVTQQVVEVLIVNPTGAAFADESITTSIGILSDAEIVSPIDDELTTSVGVSETLEEGGSDDISITTSVGIFQIALEPDEIYIRTQVGISNESFNTEIESLTTSVGFAFDFQDNFVFDDISTTVGVANDIIDDVDNELTILIKTKVGVENALLVDQEVQLVTLVGVSVEAFEQIFLVTSVGVDLTLDFQLVQPPIFTTFGILSTISVQTVENIDLTTSVGVADTLGSDNIVDTCRYSPQVGSASAGFMPPALTLPVLTHSTLTLFGPHPTPTQSVILKNPQFGDLDTLTFNRVNRDSRGGTLLVFADSSWPKSQRLELTIPNLKGEQATALEAFIQQFLGVPIGLSDWLGQSIVGVITNNPEFTQIGRDAFSVQLIFERIPS